MATVGSLGDLHPYISLALEMKRRYIDPVIATSETYRERVESLRLVSSFTRFDRRAAPTI